MAVSWSLFALDLFDRESEPHLDQRGSGLERGLLALWQKTLEEGVQDGGAPTFTAFRLDLAGGRQEDIPRDPRANPALAALRAQRHDPEVLEGLVREHLERLHGRGAAALLEKVATLDGPEAVRRFLAGPRVGGDLSRRLPRPVLEAARALATGVEKANRLPIDLLHVEADGPEAWWLGWGWDVRLRLRAHGYSGAGTASGGASRFDLQVVGLAVARKPVACRLELEDTDENGWYRRWVLDEASPLACAVREATEDAFRGA